MWRGGPQGSYGKDWPRIAEQIRDRDGRRCLACGKSEAENVAETGKRLVVDHVRPRRDGDPATRDKLDGLVSVCHRCHGKKLKGETNFRRGDVLDQRRYEQVVQGGRA